ncbi:MAG: GGDEF domain-containing protein [Lachnospiraceae bacterium]|nr:GGDEF domain-containing protein [Lachnospiraceae bacterium]
MVIKKEEHEGISLRTIHFWLIAGAVLISALMIYFTFKLSTSFHHLTDTSEQQIELRKAARELMDASDYLTEKAQRFTIDGNMQYLEQYFEEAFEANHREEAIEKMSRGEGSEEALQRLQAAMDSSIELMNQEYYAMRLVIEAKGYTDYPEVLRQVELSEEDRALSPEEKMRRATAYLLDEDYYELKEKIRTNMRASLDELERMAYATDARALKSVREEMKIVRIVIITQIILIMFMVWLTVRLGIHPVLNAVERIKADSPIPEVGANEFRYLARTYNMMYDAYKKSLERLNFKASHDELTGAYNRAGYDLLLTGIDLSSTYMMLFDIDNFKSINDTYGHETGDRVLIKLVRILKKNFRSDDYICRIGGDEFVVFMVHSGNIKHNLIASKIEKINSELSDLSDGLPAATISVGIAHGNSASDAENLFEKTDSAMYKAKQSGKHTYAFYAG